MTTKRSLAWLAVGSVAIGFLVILAIQHRKAATPQHPSAERRAPSAFSNIPRPKEADRLYTTNPKAAPPEYKKFITKFADNKNPVIQDQVGTARLKLGFLAAHQKDWTEARQAFLEADKSTKGTDRTGDFGTVNEQGAYEAIVCLDAAGKKDEARKQYNDFIHNRPLSPLCMACYRRLKRLNSGQSTPELDRMIDEVTKKQDNNAKFEASVCGPKTLEYLLARWREEGTGTKELGTGRGRGADLNYKVLAKLCHTTDTGTTIAGMIAGLKALGVKASAFQVSRQDLAKLKTPAIVLWGNHYLTVLKVNDCSIRAYDTRVRSEQDFPIPALDDPDFYLNTIILNGSPTP